jgi:hypothetical protein
VADVGAPPSAPPAGKPLHPLRALKARPVASDSVRTLKPLRALNGR